MRILYGGSLKPENAEELLALPDVDGALVGGASLEPDSFAQIIEIASAEGRRFVSTVPGVCLVILDGWGLAPDGPGNAISLAETPVFDELWETYDHTQLIACGEAVGLPPGQMGNSEVGHLNLGAGAVVPQDLLRIDKAVEDGSLAENEVILEALRAAPRVHLIGLVSDGGVHSSDRHLKALIELAAKEGVEDLVIHAFTDGRDTGPKSGAKMLATVQEWLRGGRRRPDRLGDRALLRDGPRHALGPHGEGRRAAAARHGRARGGDRRGGRARRPTSATRPTSSSPRRRSATRTRRSATATPCSRSTSAPTACARSRRRSTRTASTTTPA